MIEKKGIALRGVPMYLDMQATTPMDPRVIDAMLPFMTEQASERAAGAALRRTAPHRGGGRGPVGEREGGAGGGLLLRASRELGGGAMLGACGVVRGRGRRRGRATCRVGSWGGAGGRWAGKARWGGRRHEVGPLHAPAGAPLMGALCLQSPSLRHLEPSPSGR